MIKQNNNQIIRRPDYAGGGVTPEEFEELKLHSEKWIKIAFQTGNCNQQELIRAIKDLYNCANLKEPRVIVVPSPRVMAYAGVLAACWWEFKKRGWLNKSQDVSSSITPKMTLDATYNATRDATYNATRDATRGATYNATRDAILDATRDATYNAILDMTKNVANTTNNWLLEFAKNLYGNKQLAEAAIRALPNWYQMYQGGNMWASWSCFLSAFRDVIGLNLPEYEKFDAWERASIYGGFRIMHEEFCIVSEFPQVLKITDNGQPHCEDAPSHLWKDGFAIYHLNGTRVSREIVETPASELSADLVLKETNAQVRHEIVRKIGIQRVLTDLNAECLEADENGVYELLLLDLKDGRQRPFLKMLNPSTFEWHIEGVHPDCKTILQALNWRNGERQWSEDGAEWQQQGDVLMFPLGATSYKPFPKILT